MKTVEFKLTLNKEQQATIDRWLGVQKWVWNTGLRLIENFQKFKKWDARFQQYLPCCPVPWEYRWFDPKAEEKEKKEKEQEKPEGKPNRRKKSQGKKSESKKKDPRILVPYCRIAADTKKYIPYRRCPLLHLHYEDVPIESTSYKSLTSYFAKKNHPDKLWFTECSANFVRGTVKSLTEAWVAYLLGIRKPPTYKGKKDKIITLIYTDPKDIKFSGVKNKLELKLNHFRIPNLGIVKVKTLSQRWLNGVRASVLKICKRPSGYYLQLTGEIPAKKRIKPSDKACGLDVGLQYIYSDDVDKQVKPQKYYRKTEKKLGRLQRKFARQKQGSANSKKTVQQIAKLHEKTSLRRRSFNHKLSTYLVRTYGGIAVEDIKITNLVLRPKPKKREDGKGYERNNAKAKSGLNKSFADAGLGQLLTLIEQKAQVNDREFVRVEAAYTSQDCPACEHREKKALSQRTHKCSKCSYTAPRDVASAIIIREKANFLRVYRACPRKVKPVKDSSVGSMQQESTKVEGRSDAATTLKLPKRRRRTRSTQSEPEIQLELDLWGPALTKTS